MKHLYAVLTVAFAMAAALMFGCNRPKCQEVKPIGEIEHDLIHRIDDWLDGIDATKPQRQKLFAAMRLDKKVTGGEVKFVLARRIGSVEFGQRVPLTAIERTLNPQPSTLNH